MDNDEYGKAPSDVVDLAQELIDLYHPSLQDAGVGMLFRYKTTMVNGRVTLGKAKKLPKDVAVWLRLDFIIWLDADWYLNHLSQFQRRALIDHELCHCYKMDDAANIRPHDIEEFAVIIQRYGFWQPNPTANVERAIQRRFEFVANHGKVEALDPKYLHFLFDLESLEPPPVKEEEAATEEATEEATPDVPTLFDVSADDDVVIPHGRDPLDQPVETEGGDVLDQVGDLLDGKEEDDASSRSAPLHPQDD